MAGFVIRKRLTRAELEQAVPQIEAWFKANPKRRVCRTEYFKVRRGHIMEDMLAQEQPVK